MNILIRQLLLAAILATPFIFPAIAAEDNSQALIDDMNRLLDQAEKDRSANARFIRSAREVLRSYEWPWEYTVLDESFRDGDYTNNPPWIVDVGTFRVVRGVGLRTQVTTQSTTSTNRQGNSLDAVSAILSILSQGAVQQQSQTSSQSEKAAIHTVAPIPNSFLIEVDVSSISNNGGFNFSFGPYQGDRRDTGYQLVYFGGSQPVIELHRFMNGRSAIVEVHDNVPLVDTGIHTITWQRNLEGEMTVMMDDTELFTTNDRGIRGAFTGFALVNETGQLGISRVRIDGEAN